ncbi:urea carboxylase [uncultured Desulfobacter sp.]|uniref:urea carboxylase n=1 Tax=uncultured Desulfobacter sp. TaxID=240139 RepID=UPI002AA7C2FC|nr:urea carboxylase [uncultured Desulfobacter sp.]
MFTKVLVANRGEIAVRIIRTLKKMNIASVAVYSEADAHAMHVLEADESILIGPPAAAQSYLDTTAILAAARQCGAQAIHPGYGFLSENADFADQCAKAGISFIGPSGSHIREFGLKHRARQLAEQFDVPLVPGSQLLPSLEDALAAVMDIGYPVMLKSTSGGGGIGMALCQSDQELSQAWDRIKRLSENNFNDGGLFLEKYIAAARHIEVQIFGDGQGNAQILGDRDCSVQRRNQKVIEETPAPGLSDGLRSSLHEAARRLAQGVGYASAGTVEFVYDTLADQFYFLEVNTRLQVEHCVTEAVFGIDLVEWMVQLAANDLPPLTDMNPTSSGAAIEVRIYAEDPGKAFRPSTGLLIQVVFPESVRVDSWVASGTFVSAFYDPLLSKLIVHGPTREEAVLALKNALAETRLKGIETNLHLLRSICEFPAFQQGAYTTRILDNYIYQALTICVDAPGMQTTVQDFPGRTGYWSVGVPPSGPMDMLNHRLANRIAGNPPEAAALEITVKGPDLIFNAETIFVLTGAEIQATLDGEPVPRYTPVTAPAGAKLKSGIAVDGQRACLAVRGGIDVPLYMGSRSTFTLGQFGGHGGRSLQTGDVLWTGNLKHSEPCALEPSQWPSLTDQWEIGVLYGPHGAPDFFTPKDMETFFSTAWEVHYNSSRTGVRLIGPGPEWARQDGGEAGLHPSNIHDTPYAVGAVDYTGDMPVILGPDGPSLGGFVCPVTIVQAELWKMGQLKAGSRVRFRLLSPEEARILEECQETLVQDLNRPEPEAPLKQRAFTASETPIIHQFSIDGDIQVVCRRSGDKNLLIEFGKPVLDLTLRFHVHALMLALEEKQLDGILDLTPGIRSLQIHYDNRIQPLDTLLETIESVQKTLAGSQNRKVPARIVHLPLSWDDPATHKAIERYTQSVRPDAPWCPSNIEFIRRINGLDSIEDVKNVLFNASYLVMGLGDVYLGAPVATPLDPRYRLVTTKYNPARTWTPENAVGIGGAYLCVYGMEGPGGYQFVGRTVQMWNRYNVTEEFKPGKPWLLRFFDQIRFYPVDHDTLMEMRKNLPYGLAGIRIEESEFDLDKYEAFLAENEESIHQFKDKQQTAFEAERQQWIENGQLNFSSEIPEHTEDTDAVAVMPGCQTVDSAISGSLWKMQVKEGDVVEDGQTIAILECMKMEVDLKSCCAGEVCQIFCSPGDLVSSGQHLVSIKPCQGDA